MPFLWDGNLLRRNTKACCLHLEDSTLPFYETLIKLRCLVAVSATVSTAVSSTAVIAMSASTAVAVATWWASRTLWLYVAFRLRKQSAH